MLAGGALETPAILLRSGIGGPAAGEYLRLHPGTAVIGLYDETPDLQPWRVDPAHPDHLLFNPLSPSVGELRGFSRDGKEVDYIGNPSESDNIDVFATDLATGKTRRVTRNPAFSAIRKGSLSSLYSKTWSR